MNVSIRIADETDDLLGQTSPVQKTYSRQLSITIVT